MSAESASPASAGENRPPDGDGERLAVESLFATLYTELRRLARRQLDNHLGVSLGASSLLHEAYLDMSQREGAAFPDRAHFMAYAARVMRSLIIDHARARRTHKRGGALEISGLELDALEPAGADFDLERLGAGLDELATLEPALAQVVDLKYFCGFSFAEIAALQGVTERTVQRHWAKARIYLHRTLRDSSL